VRAVHDTLKALQEGTPADRLERIAGNDLMQRLTREENDAQWTSDFL